MSETPLVKELMLAASKWGARLFRNNVGMGWAPSGSGKNIVVIKREGIIAAHPGDVLVRKARPLHAGLCKGSSDLIGWRTVVITPEMVGQKFAIFCAPEVKTPLGKLRAEQKNFIRTVNEHGGLAGTVRSEEDLFAMLGTPDVKF